MSFFTVFLPWSVHLLLRISFFSTIKTGFKYHILKEMFWCAHSYHPTLLHPNRHQSTNSNIYKSLSICETDELPASPDWNFMWMGATAISVSSLCADTMPSSILAATGIFSHGLQDRRLSPERQCGMVSEVLSSNILGLNCISCVIFHMRFHLYKHNHIFCNLTVILITPSQCCHKDGMKIFHA